MTSLLVHNFIGHLAGIVVIQLGIDVLKELSVTAVGPIKLQSRVSSALAKKSYGSERKLLF